MISVSVLQKHSVDDKYVWGKRNGDSYVDWPKFAKAKIDSGLPSIIGALDTETGESAAVGFHYRRTSHSTDIEWWGGDRVDLVACILRAMVWSAILEGRKRVECFHVTEGRPQIDEAFLDAGFKFEGTHKDYTAKLEDVNVYGHVWLQDGIPEPSSNSHTNLVYNDRVKFYHEKNLELYKKDIDLHREDKKGITFATHIASAVGTVCNLPRVSIIRAPGWHGNEKKSVSV